MVGHRKQVAHGVDTASLPGGALEAAGDRFGQPGVGVGGHQAHTAQPAVDQPGQELAPERLVLRVADVDTEDFAMAVGTQPGGDHDRLGHDVAVLADVDVGGVQPHVHERLVIKPPCAQHGDVGVDPGADA